MRGRNRLLARARASAHSACLPCPLSPSFLLASDLGLSPARSAYYFTHKQTQETLWELDAAELARVRAEAVAAGLSPMP